MNMMTLHEESDEAAALYPSAENNSEARNNVGIMADHDDALASKRSFLERFRWFRNLTLRGKVNAVFGTFFGIGFAMSLVLGLGLGEMWLRYSAAERLNDAVYEAVELRSIAGDLRYNSARFLFVGEDIILERRQSGFEAAQARVDAVETILTDALPGMVPMVTRMRSELTTYNSAFVAVITAQSQNADSERVTVLGQRLAERGESTIAATRALADTLAAERESAKRAGITYFSYLIMILITLAVLATGILFLGMRYLSHDFSRKIEEVTDGMTRLARGDLEFAITGHDRKDEIGAMLRALGLFKRSHQQLEVWARERADRAEETIRLQAERDLEREQADERKSKLLDEVAWQFERTVGEVVEKVASASAELGHTATTMATTAEDASGRTSDLAQSIEEANIGATAAAAASDEFALSIGEISRQATSSSELARLANDATEEADETISALSSSADQVGQIVELIQTIAQRTNLLALNASIEAARGGEAGRGFAVVASEVKELAMRTSRATEEVATQIRAMQDSTGASVTALRSIASQVKDLESTATAIATAVDQQSIAGQDLARNIDMAARGTDKVANNIKDVRELSLSTGVAAKQVLTSSTELEDQAATLNDQVQTFLNRIRST